MKNPFVAVGAAMPVGPKPMAMPVGPKPMAMKPPPPPPNAMSAAPLPAIGPVSANPPEHDARFNQALTEAGIARPGKGTKGPNPVARNRPRIGPLV